MRQGGESPVSQKSAIVNDEIYDYEKLDIQKPKKVDPSRWEMTKHFLSLAGPSVVTNFFSYMVMTVNTIFAG